MKQLRSILFYENRIHTEKKLDGNYVIRQQKYTLLWVKAVLRIRNRFTLATRIRVAQNQP